MSSEIFTPAYGTPEGSFFDLYDEMLGDQVTHTRLGPLRSPAGPSAKRRDMASEQDPLSLLELGPHVTPVGTSEVDDMVAYLDEAEAEMDTDDDDDNVYDSSDDLDFQAPSTVNIGRRGPKSPVQMRQPSMPSLTPAIDLFRSMNSERPPYTFIDPATLQLQPGQSAPFGGAIPSILNDVLSPSEVAASVPQLNSTPVKLEQADIKLEEPSVLPQSDEELFKTNLASYNDDSNALEELLMSKQAKAKEVAPTPHTETDSSLDAASTRPSLLSPPASPGESSEASPMPGSPDFDDNDNDNDNEDEDDDDSEDFSEFSPPRLAKRGRTSTRSSRPTKIKASLKARLRAAKPTKSGTGPLRDPHTCGMHLADGSLCRKMFTRTYDLTRHQVTVHATKRRKFKCDNCPDGREFSRLDALVRHNKSKHSH